MFHKMQDRVVAAASNTLGIANTTTNIENERSAASHTMTTVQSLQALGHCTVTEVESALHTADENIDLAAEIILSQPQQQQQPQRLMLTNTANTTDQMDEDMELQRALQQSLTTITGHARTTTTILFGHYESNCGRCISTS